MDKRELRHQARRARASLSGDDRASASEAAQDHLLALPELAAAQRVLLYAAHGDEVATDRVLATLVERGRVVLLPRVVAGDELDVVEVDGPDALVAGYRGVREPTGPAVDRHDIDVVVVPGIAFDRDGGRLGQGGGHYDRLFARLPDRTLRVALAFAVQVVERVPRDPHDQPVDVLVTEDGATRTGAR